MKVTKTIDVPATTKVVDDHYVCDLCGTKTQVNGLWPGQFGNSAETTVEMKQGDGWGTDGGDIAVTSFDVCIDCFQSKVVPWFRSQGAEPRIENIDW